MIVGARGVNANGNLSSGASYVVFGTASGFPTTLSVDDLNGTNGFRLDGVAVMDNAGFAVTGCDINGDGLDDLVVSAPFGGKVYVDFGHTGPYAATETLAGGVAFFDSFATVIGRDVANAGDINGDGVSDLIIGRPAGAAIVYGNSSLSGNFDLAELDGTNGFIASNGAFAGGVVSGGGDINGDGYDDVLIGTEGPVSNAYVVFGGAAGVNLRLDLLNGTNGFLLTVADPANGVRLGSALSNAGDVNGDGFDDIIVGAKLTDAHGEAEAGVSYVVFGKAGGFGSVINVDELDGTNGFRIEGAQEGDHLGIAVSNAGDVNGDGYDDLLVGTESGGNTYLLFGSGTGFAPTIDLASLSGSQGIRLEAGLRSRR
jgi:hypothetical protein